MAVDMENDLDWSEDGDVPFEALDPCCQREILDRRRYNEVTRKLRPVDRSLRRLDERKAVVKDLKTRNIDPWTCGCCVSNEDYNSLRRLKEILDVNHDADTSIEKDAKSDNNNNEDDDDDDLLDDDFPLTDYERERMEQALMETQKRAAAAQSPLRLALHLEESVGHLMFLIQRIIDIPIVVHVYQDDPLSALIDYTFERTLAPKYPGTMFRRVSTSSTISFHDLETQRKDLIEEFNTALVDNRHCILIFRRGQLATTLKPQDLVALGDTLELVSRHLIRVLDHAHVLCDDLPAMVLHPRLLEEEGIVAREEDGEEEAERFCDDPDCTKHFPHEHVGRRPGAASTTGPSFLLSRDQEVFAPGALQRI